MWKQQNKEQLQQVGIENHREKAEVYRGDSMCKQKSKELLELIQLPGGLLPLDDMEEVGHNLDTGFVWVKQKRAKEHKFKMIGRLVWYDTEITAFVQDRRMRRLTGVKSKELLFWVSISDIRIADPDSKKLTFRTPTGMSRSFPLEAFQIEYHHHHHQEEPEPEPEPEPEEPEPEKDQPDPPAPPAAAVVVDQPDHDVVEGGKETEKKEEEKKKDTKGVDN